MRKCLAAIERVCASQHFVLGSEVEALEREMAAFTGATAAVGCASGTDALWLALLAAEVQPGDAVITTAFSFFASASAIVRAGARPVLVDVDPDTLNLGSGLREGTLACGRLIQDSSPAAGASLRAMRRHECIAEHCR